MHGSLGKSSRYYRQIDDFFFAIATSVCETLNKMARSAGRFVQVKLLSHSSGVTLYENEHSQSQTKAVCQNLVRFLDRKHF